MSSPIDSGRVVLPPPGPAPDSGASVSGDAATIVCPECSAELRDRAHAIKHATGHYGERRVPNDHWNATAHERQSFLLGRPVLERV